MRINTLQKKLRKNKQYFIGLITGFLLGVFLLNIAPLTIAKTRSNLIAFTRLFNPSPTPTPTLEKKLEEITKDVLPEEVSLDVSFKDTVIRLVKTGAIDREKFLSLYQERGGLSPQEQALLDKPSEEKLAISTQNANLLLNLLWPLGIANKTTVLSEGPMGKEYAKDVGSFASTGGWTLGKQTGGQLFNKYPILPLTAEQETLVKEIAENIFRPCCGNSTYFPDCNHGAAMLGFIELAVSQGMPKEIIYQKALALNSFWFPQTYADLAVYFQKKKNTPWKNVDAKEVLGSEYSGGQGYRKISKLLQDEGLLPKVTGGGGCGV